MTTLELERDVLRYALERKYHTQARSYLEALGAEALTGRRAPGANVIPRLGPWLRIRFRLGFFPHGQQGSTVVTLLFGLISPPGGDALAQSPGSVALDGS